MPSKDSGLHCSFCGKNQKEVKKLIAGPNVYVCDECIQLCNDIIAEEVEKDSNQLLNYTNIIKQNTMDIKKDIIEHLWKILISDDSVDQYESNLMRRVCGLIYFPDKECAEIKLKLINSK